MGGGGYVGLLSFFSFIISVIAAVLAIDLYALLRTGRSGSTWRVLIIASVMFALMQALRLAALLRFGGLGLTRLSEIVELIFVMALAYAFYLQRQVFGPREQPGLATPRTAPTNTERNSSQARSEPPKDTRPNAPQAKAGEERSPSMDSRTNSQQQPEPEDEDFEDEEAASEWARLSGQSDGAGSRRKRRVAE